MKLYDVPEHDEPLLLSDEHAELLGVVEHVEETAVPSQRAAKALWVAYAISQGADPASVEQMTRAEIIDAWG